MVHNTSGLKRLFGSAGRGVAGLVMASRRSRMVLAGRGITSKSDSAESSSALIVMFCFALDGCP